MLRKGACDLPRVVFCFSGLAHLRSLKRAWPRRSASRSTTGPLASKALNDLCPKHWFILRELTTKQGICSPACRFGRRQMSKSRINRGTRLLLFKKVVVDESELQRVSTRQNSSAYGFDLPRYFKRQNTLQFQKDVQKPQLLTSCIHKNYEMIITIKRPIGVGPDWPWYFMHKSIHVGFSALG